MLISDAIITHSDLHQLQQHNFAVEVLLRNASVIIIHRNAILWAIAM